MDDASPSTTYLTQNAGKDLPSNFARILKAPAYTNSVQLDTAYKGSKTAQTGSTDSSITGYKIPVSWDFSSLSGSFNAWASTAIDLKGSSSMLSSCTKFSVALKTDSAISDTNYSLYLQLGVDASDDF